MKRIKLTVLLTLLSFYSFSQNYVSETIVDKEINSTNYNFTSIEDVSYYIDKNFIVKYPIQKVFSKKIIALTSKKKSWVKIYSNNIIKSNSEWVRVSNVIPNNNKLVITISLESNPILFMKPINYRKKDFKKIDCQILFSSAFYRGYYDNVKNSKPYTFSWVYKYNSKDLWTSFKDKKQYKKDTNAPKFTLFSTDNLDRIYSLINYRIFFCGDGLLNGINGNKYNNGVYEEECDPNDSNKTNWGKNGCDCNCKKK